MNPSDFIIMYVHTGKSYIYYPKVMSSFPHGKVNLQWSWTEHLFYFSRFGLKNVGSWVLRGSLIKFNGTYLWCIPSWEWVKVRKMEKEREDFKWALSQQTDKPYISIHFCVVSCFKLFSSPSIPCIKSSGWLVGKRKEINYTRVEEAKVKSTSRMSLLLPFLTQSPYFYLPSKCYVIMFKWGEYEW
jgi:hypothetical protein